MPFLHQFIRPTLPVRCSIYPTWKRSGYGTLFGFLIALLPVDLVSCLSFLNTVRSRALVVGNARYPLRSYQSCFAFQLPSTPSSNPQMQPFKFALQLFLASALAVCAVKNITVDDFDPRIVYTPPSAWTHLAVGCLSTSLSSADLWAP